MNFSFRRLNLLPEYVFAQVNEARIDGRHNGLDIIDFGMGNPDGPTPAVVVDKLIEAARNRRNHRYSVSHGIANLRLEITKRYKSKWGVELDPEAEAVVTIGVKDALAHLLYVTLGPGDVVIAPTPAYPIHHAGVKLTGATLSLLPILSDQAEILSRLEDKYRRKRMPKMLLLSFPHNPTTVCVNIDFMKEIVRLADRHGTMVVHDFAYADLGFDGWQPPSILQVEGAKEVAVEMFSMTKSYNMAGWRVGFCLGNRKMVAALARIKSYLDYGVFQPIQIASIIALRQCEEDTRCICGTYQKRRDTLVAGLNRAGWPVKSPKGTMFLWAPIPTRFRKLGSLKFSKLLLEKAKVAVAPGIGFGKAGDGHVRFALIENEFRIRQACRQIKQFLAKG